MTARTLTLRGDSPDLGLFGLGDLCRLEGSFELMAFSPRCAAITGERAHDATASLA